MLRLLEETRTKFLEDASNAEANAVQAAALAMKAYEAKKKVASSLPLQYERTLRYETALDRQLYRAIDELETRQRNRRQLSNMESSNRQST